MALSTKFAPVALIAALAVAGGPLMAQEPPPPPAPAASIKLDFGAGRKVDIKCGELAIEACIAAATPLIEKVATTPVPDFGMRGGKKGPKGERPLPEGHPPVPPPAEGDAPPPPPPAE